MIIERIDRSGHIIETHAYNSDSICLGRNYDSDLIVRDLHVDGHQLMIKYDPETETYTVSDLNSTNGFSTHGKKVKKYKSGDSVQLSSGDVFSIGRTRFKILNESHPIPPTHIISWYDSLNTILSRRITLLAILSCIVLINVFSIYMDSPFTEDLFKDSIDIIFIPIPALIYGLIWVFIARTQHMESQLLTHISVVLSLTLIASFVTFLNPILSFNMPNVVKFLNQSGLLGSLAAFILIYWSCYLSTKLNRRRRILVSLAIPFLIISTLLIAQLKGREFKRSPEYDMRMVSTAFQWRESESTEHFLSKTKLIYKEPTEKAVERHKR